MQAYFPFIIEGITLGLGLAILLGPIFVALTQTSVEHGARAGITVGTGIWISDILIVGITFLFINKISSIIQDGEFQFWMGLTGGIILIGLGVSAMLKKIEINYEKKSFNAKNYLGFWLKGFLVNTINPFTFIFWIGVISTYVIGSRGTARQVSVFLITILLTIIITDSIKVFGAKYLKKKLKGDFIQWVIRAAGFILLVFGMVLIYRVS